MEITVKTPLKKTEDSEKVKRALLNIFPDIELGISGEWIVGSTKSLEKLKDMLRNQKIRAAARTVFLKNKISGKFVFQLNKQTAYVGKINFIEDERQPLGTISVVVENANPDDLIEYVTKTDWDNKKLGSR